MRGRMLHEPGGKQRFLAYGQRANEEIYSVSRSALNALLYDIAAKRYGVPYRFGGQSRAGMDCPGFIRQVFADVYGWELPHNSAALSKRGDPVERGKLEEGDLVFFANLGFVDHAGIYMGKGYFIHSATSVGVAYSALDAPYFGDHYAGARRLRPAN